MDGEGGSVVGDGAVTKIDKVIHGVAGSVTWANPLGIHERRKTKKDEEKG